ncbi:hypothetical protein J2Z23_001740 [Lederbergia galactosidilyticus]|uniref:endolytic transglycosylase MltG n=1 Tax=Lederbergia galactosidilytica TaxID=217031 RepID=UPI001AE895F8|nr:endolytic transglycosylase MltG [Lederbergia galactosidilytica]MBP1914786.1 hypothetical protein [Lederbergia galactosidilytica]
MDKRGTRGLAIGLLLSAICIFAFQYLNLKDTEPSTPTTNTNINEAKLEKLQNEVQDWQTKYEELEKKQINEKKKEAAEEDKEEPTSVEILIKEGMSSKEISDQLAAAGIVHDSEDFNDYLEAKELQTKVRTGKFKMDKDLSYQEISEILTRQK